MTPERDYIRLLLNDLRHELRHQGLWTDEPPSVEALGSHEPFCVDTMPLENWLQFIFIPRMEAILDADGPLPGQCIIRTYAEEHYATRHNTHHLVRIIGKLDIMITRGT